MYDGVYRRYSIASHRIAPYYPAPNSHPIPSPADPNPNPNPLLTGSPVPRCYDVSLLVPSMKGSEALVAAAIQQAVADGLCKPGDQVVVAHGSVEAKAGSTCLLRVYTV